ncbi:HsKin17 protein [Thecamonas trahens ATCC 50062]|uniref:HsKin17 protein n=1 Tax=Thecamonas trahens ATCC 50062 TaxID=461836 RepID=A0A0L0DEM5_THETB|nr:HsKin17 protein [Thecamonas trahens ATCC 50062]KNC50670.1 HsKin17 protein [Thecamonas trahens ATCC 50062]|eukprot:XP_013762550.1 HsKin17 protein [Thecamonas trahens ATCC 50062]
MSARGGSDRNQKRRGLRKIKFYCQMCEKECSDRNGFEAHSRSAGHLAKMELFAANPEKYLAMFSDQFEADFMELVKSRHRGRKVLVNYVHNEYVQDRSHVRLNGTRWKTLDEFAQHLSSKGIVELSYDDDGNPYIKYIDVAVLSAREKHAEKERKRKARVAAKLEDQRRSAMEASVAAARAAGSLAGPVLELARPPDSDTISVALPAKAAQPAPLRGPAAALDPLQPPAPLRTAPATLPSARLPAHPKPLSNVERILQETRAREARDAARATWAVPGAVVRILDASLDSLFKAKAVVVSRHASPRHLVAVAVVGTPPADRVLVDIDEALLRPVLPPIGKPVVVVRGEHAGERGVLVDHMPSDKSLAVRLDATGITVRGLGYAAVCKVRARG